MTTMEGLADTVEGLERDVGISVVDVRTGDEQGDGFVGTALPTLRWRIDATRPDIVQRAYQIEIADDQDFSRGVERGAVVDAYSPIAAVWPGRALESRETRFVRVRVWADGGASAWSDPARVEAALLREEDWTACPVSGASNVDRVEPAPVMLLRRRFVVKGEIARARLYVTALGVHETYLNGERVGDALLEPGWTAYQERLLYAAHDVTDRIAQGENVLAAEIGDGWWRGWLTWMKKRAVYGSTTAFMAQLEIEYRDGTAMTVATDDHWRASTGATSMADLYNGCRKDLRLEQHGWKTSEFDDSSWEPVTCLPRPQGLELRSMPPVRVIDRWAVAAVPQDGGELLVDIGQNVAGFLSVTASGPRGAVIRVRHAEVLDNHGRLYTSPLRDAEAMDSYVLDGRGEQMLEPSFTFHGFRFAAIDAGPGVSIDRVEACAVASDLRLTGRFECSDPRLNRLFDNVRWSQLGNFLALPTDCPQRDERLGWTGDIQVFAQTAATNADVLSFLASWLKDLELEQRADGCVPSTAPNVIQGHQFEYGGVGWGDAATLVPWALYEAYGDPKVLRDQFDSMRTWVDYGASRRGADGAWRGDLQLGDWLDPGAPPDMPHQAMTNGDFIATAYLSFSADVVGKAAEIVGRPELGATYGKLSQEVAAAAWSLWREHAMSTQAGCAIALQFGIAPAGDRAAVVDALDRIVIANNYRIGTGFLGTLLVLPALSAGGRLETAYRLLLNEDCPGWLYQVARGATTMWERWDAVREDGSLHIGEMSTEEGASMISFNHYAYGAVAAWLYRTVAGIAPTFEAPGYALIEFAPQPGGDLDRAEASVETVFGKSSIAWRIGAELVVDIEIAPGSRGRFVIPPGWAAPDAGDRRELSLGSGRHRFELARA